MAVLRDLAEQIPFAAEIRVEAGDQFLANRIERRVGHLREELAEIVVEKLRLVAQTRQRRVGAHAADRLLTDRGHRHHDHLQIFDRVAKDVLADEQGLMVRLAHVPRGGKIVQRNHVFLEPFLPRTLLHQAALDFVVVDDAALLEVDQENLAGL